MKAHIKIQWLTEQGALPPVSAEPGADLLEICRQNKIYIEAPCGGNGTCGKCRVQIVRGTVPVTEAERRIFTEEELSAGYRLACRVKAAEDLTVRICRDKGEGGEIQSIGLSVPEQSAGLSVREQSFGRPAPASAAGRSAPASAAGRSAPEESVREQSSGRSAPAPVTGGPVPAQSSRENGLEGRGGLYIAVDLGSTTLAAVLITGSGTILAQASAVNSQRAYGADVISRIQASNEGKGEELRACIRRDLEQLFRTLLAGREDARILGIAIAANTVMLHLLRGYSCEKLGQAPFQPVNLELECLDYAELFSDMIQCRGSRVYLLPGLSAFVGADIAAGLYSSGFLETPEDETAVFLDLGTNGELAVGNKAGFATASTAAGPAFEGGRLTCGIPGIPGAVSKVSFLYHRVRVQTIGQKKPCGICGTGALEAAAALLREGLMDKEGLLAPPLFAEGLVLAQYEDGSRIRLTQADIREIQMAKAAVRAGIEVLLLRYGEIYGKPARELVRRIYLAGGFGCYLLPDTAAAVGLLPCEWKDKIIVCGNTSLKGAAAFFTDTACAAALAGLSSKNREIQLAGDSCFQNLYLQEMRFPGDAAPLA